MRQSGKDTKWNNLFPFQLYKETRKKRRGTHGESARGCLFYFCIPSILSSTFLRLKFRSNFDQIFSISYLNVNDFGLRRQCCLFLFYPTFFTAIYCIANEKGYFLMLLSSSMWQPRPSKDRSESSISSIPAKQKRWKETNEHIDKPTHTYEKMRKSCKIRECYG